MQERAVNDARADAAGHFSPQVLLSLSFTKQAIESWHNIALLFFSIVCKFQNSTQSICHLVIKSPIVLGTDC
jgi:hypothetical protein